MNFEQFNNGWLSPCCGSKSDRCADYGNFFTIECCVCKGRWRLQTPDLSNKVKVVVMNRHIDAEIEKLQENKGV